MLWRGRDLSAQSACASQCELAVEQFGLAEQMDSVCGTKAAAS